MYVGLGLPRLNKASALIEVAFDSLYLEDIVQDTWFLKVGRQARYDVA